MNTIKCPECKLVNMGSALSCRRCATPLIPGGKGKASGSQTLNFRNLTGGLAIAAIVIGLAFWMYGLKRKDMGVPTSQPAAVAENGAKIEKGPVSRELEEAKKLSSNFVARMDQNMSDRSGHGFEKNQALASDTLKLMREQMSSFADPAAKKHLEEFSRLLERYYEQLAAYNADTRNLAASSQRMKNDIEQIQQDSSLSSEEKSSQERELRRKYLDESQTYNGTSKDIEAAMLSLRTLTAGS